MRKYFSSNRYGAKRFKEKKIKKFKNKILYSILILLSFSPMVMAGWWWEDYVEPINIDKLKKPSVYDERFKHLSKRVTFPGLLSNSLPFDVNKLAEVNSLHPGLRWMIGIDARCFIDGPFVFDKAGDSALYFNLGQVTNESGRKVYGKIIGEKGYYDGIWNGVNIITKPGFMEMPIDARFVMVLNHATTKDLTDMKQYTARTFGMGDRVCLELLSNYPSRPCIEKSFKYNDEGINYNSEGLVELFKKEYSPWDSDKIASQGMGIKHEIDGEDDFNGVFKVDRTRVVMIPPVIESFDDFKKKVNIIFKDYYSKLNEIKENGFATGSKLAKNASDEDKKLEVIVRICQNFVQLHPFHNGNLRVTYLLLQRMLIENGFDPACLYEPNMLGFKSVQEMIDEVKTGMRIYREVVVPASKSLFEQGIPSDPNMTHENIEKIFGNIPEDLISKIEFIKKEEDAKKIKMSTPGKPGLEEDAKKIRMSTPGKPSLEEDTKKIKMPTPGKPSLEENAKKIKMPTSDKPSLKDYIYSIKKRALLIGTNPTYKYLRENFGKIYGNPVKEQSKNYTFTGIKPKNDFFPTIFNYEGAEDSGFVIGEKNLDKYEYIRKCKIFEAIGMEIPYNERLRIPKHKNCK